MTEPPDVARSESEEAFDPSPYLPQHDEPNTRPGPTDQGGHGGMATREQEAKQSEHSDAESNTESADTP